MIFSSAMKTIDWKNYRDQVVAAARRESSWLVPAIILLAIFMFHRPADRFESTQNINLALDRKTGQLCSTNSAWGEVPFPLCSDLTKWWRLW